MENATKRPRGRPRKSTPQPSRPDPTEKETAPDPDLVGQPDDVVDDASTADLERELQRAMDAVDDVQVFPVDRIVDEDDLGHPFPHSRDVGECQPAPNVTKAIKVKKMSSTTRKMMKFGYSQVLRAADTVTKGKVPGEKMAYILRNDEAADAILDEILNELDQKYKVEQYLGPESKLALFTAQLFIQARESQLDSEETYTSSSSRQG